MTMPILDVKNIRVTFPIRGGSLFSASGPTELLAVSDVDLAIRPGETLGIVGESGCGKSTLARAILRLVNAEGRAIWNGKTDLMRLSPRQMLSYRSDIQMIFQDPVASLNPRLPIGEIIAEPLRTHRKQLSARDIRSQVVEMMIRVGLRPEQINHFPHQFSGGQCQRIGIARALISRPRLVICDEPVSALDVSIRAQIINLLVDLQKEMGLALLFISHDLNVVRHISDRVMVLYLGRVVETGSTPALFSSARHPYTRALLSAIPSHDPQSEREPGLMLLDGELPSPLNPPSGCAFRTRCPQAQPLCIQNGPSLSPGAEDAQRVACHFPLSPSLRHGI